MISKFPDTKSILVDKEVIKSLQQGPTEKTTAQIAEFWSKVMQQSTLHHSKVVPGTILGSNKDWALDPQISSDHVVKITCYEHGAVKSTNS